MRWEVSAASLGGIRMLFNGSAINLVWGAVFTLLLVSACVSDVRQRRIPNELVAILLGTGWLYALYAPDIGRALGMSVAGTALGFAIWFVFYIVGAIGAGDVKFFAAASAWLGPALALRASLLAALVGGVLAVIFLLRERRLGAVMQRVGLAVAARTPAVLAEHSRQAQHAALPYGVALAIGAGVAAWFPWSS